MMRFGFYPQYGSVRWLLTRSGEHNLVPFHKLIELCAFFFFWKDPAAGSDGQLVFVLLVYGV